MESNILLIDRINDALSHYYVLISARTDIAERTLKLVEENPSTAILDELSKLAKELRDLEFEISEVKDQLHLAIKDKIKSECNEKQ